MPARSLEETILDLVHGFAADLVPLVRQAALDAAREALMREGRVKATRVIELTPAAPPVTAATKAAPPSMPQRFAGANHERLDDAILRHLAANPGLRSEEITRGLVADPADVKRALAGLRADGLVQTTGQRRGMRYSIAGDAAATRDAEAEQDAEAAEETTASVAEG